MTNSLTSLVRYSSFLHLANTSRRSIKYNLYLNARDRSMVSWLRTMPNVQSLDPASCKYAWHVNSDFRVVRPCTFHLHLTTSSCLLGLGDQFLWLLRPGNVVLNLTEANMMLKSYLLYHPLNKFPEHCVFCSHWVSRYYRSAEWRRLQWVCKLLLRNHMVYILDAPRTLDIIIALIVQQNISPAY